MAGESPVREVIETYLLGLDKRKFRDLEECHRTLIASWKALDEAIDRHGLKVFLPELTRILEERFPTVDWRLASEATLMVGTVYDQDITYYLWVFMLLAYGLMVGVEAVCEDVGDGYMVSLSPSFSLSLMR